MRGLELESPGVVIDERRCPALVFFFMESPALHIGVIQRRAATKDLTDGKRRKAAVGAGRFLGRRRAAPAE
jgi:hypothetical protein